MQLFEQFKERLMNYRQYNNLSNIEDNDVVERFCDEFKHQLYRIVDVNGIRIPFFATHHIAICETEDTLLFYVNPIPLVTLDPKEDCDLWVLSDLNGNNITGQSYQNYNRQPYKEYGNDIFIASFSLCKKEQYHIVDTQDWINRRLTWEWPRSNDLLKFYPVIPCENILPKYLLPVLLDGFDKSSNNNVKQISFSMTEHNLKMSASDIISEFNRTIFNPNKLYNLVLPDDKTILINVDDEQTQYHITIESALPTISDWFDIIQNVFADIYYAYHDPNHEEGYWPPQNTESFSILISKTCIHMVKINNGYQHTSSYETFWCPINHVLHNRRTNVSLTSGIEFN